MGPAALAQVLRPLADLHGVADPDLLVGLSGPDDAAVYRLNERQAVVLTADFFPPVVDDPFTYGAIAAANAMSDVYAMGGEVRLALNLVAYPVDLPPEVVTEILRGAAEKVREGGGFVATSQSPSRRVTGSRTRARYAARSAAVSSPPRATESAAIRAASSPV